MANKNIFNVNSELAAMKKYIADVDYYTSKVKEVSSSAVVYQKNIRTVAATIASTVYALACAWLLRIGLRDNIAILIIGIVLAIAIIMLSGTDGFACALSVSVIASSYLFFMYFFSGISLIGVLAEWIYVIFCFLKFKSQAGQISSSL